MYCKGLALRLYCNQTHMNKQRTAGSLRVTERQKARARLVLLTLVGLICPPLAGARSPAIWALYVVLVVGYSLWALRLTRRYSGDRLLGFLLCLTDGAVLLPLLAWSSAVALWVVLIFAWAAGLLATRAAGESSKGVSRLSGFGPALVQPETVRGNRGHDDPEALLDGALRMRLQVLRSTNTRFALVVLRVLRFEDIADYYGHDLASRVLAAVGHRGSRLLGSDAQVFLLASGRVAFVFATGATAGAVASTSNQTAWIDPYDVESLAMALGRRACEHLIDGQKVECVVGWASAPADGVSVEDLLYAADSGALSTAAFRRVAGSGVPVPERTRAAAG
jgi:GGDEF domain-containing protein